MLGGKSREELLNLLIDLSGRFPAVRQHIVEAEQLAGGQVGKLVAALQSEIRRLTAEPVWYNAWRDEGNLPDYSHVEQQLRALAGQGHGDAAVKLGEELWRRGNAQVEQSDDEGETAQAIATCLAVVIAALPKSSLTPPEQLLWVIDRVLEDQYSLLDTTEALFGRPIYTQSHWQEVAERLEARLQALEKPHSANFSQTYRRERLLNQLLDAYDRAGWNEKIIPRLEAEADASRCYQRLVDALLAAGEPDRARHWCIQGYGRTTNDAPGIASALQERLRTLAQQAGRYDLVAAYRAQDFFQSPSKSGYSELHQAAERAKCWPAVRSAVLHYLETGQRPVTGNPVDASNGWPLPSPEVEPPAVNPRNSHRQFPNLDILIDIAILEKRINDVAGLYQRLLKTQRWGRETDKKVAQAVADTHPDLALGIWQGIAEGLIAVVKPKAYEEAAIYLRHMEEVYRKNQRLDEWLGLLNRLRSLHKAKRRLMEVLDTLSKVKLVE